MEYHPVGLDFRHESLFHTKYRVSQLDLFQLDELA